MRQLTEFTYSIDSREIAKILPGNTETGQALLELEGIGAQEVRLVSVRSNIKGLVKYVLCPECKSRVRKLYLPEGFNMFVCRTCSGLGYRAQYSRDFRKTKYEKKHITMIEKQRINRADSLKQFINMLKQRGLLNA